MSGIGDSVSGLQPGLREEALARHQADLAKLSPEQREVVDSWGEGLAVLAGAGAGKTTTLVIKCCELLRKKPEARFAAVSFTERSASDLREKLSERLSLSGEGGALSGHWVMTIHGLCGAVIREFPREAGFDGEEGMLSETEAAALWERSTEGLWIDDLPEDIQQAFELLLERESRDSILSLLRRVRELHSFGVLKFLDSSEDPASRALARTGLFVLDRYERLKRRRGMLDFNDLERGADRALEHAHVRAEFQRRFDLVMVDEFQDTNPLQAKIIWRFVKPGASNLCVVGDPKQSIYRFRDADVSVFEDLCSRLPKRLSLTWNFRSRPGIIEFANRVCSKAFEVSNMPYEALVPKREATEDFAPVERLAVTDPLELGKWLRSEMERGVPLHDMALLLRKIRGNEKWLKALSSAGIPVAIGSGGLFWEDPRVRELTAFLKWWDNPGNALSGAVFMRAPWMGVPDEVIDQWLKQDSTLEEPFFSSTYRMAEVLRPLRSRLVRPGELLMALLIDDEVEKELGAPLLGLWHRAEELSSRGFDFHEVVTDLARAMDESRRDRDVPPPRNLGQLVVLTLHASKGLEFPHVILLDFPEKPSRASDAPLLFWDRIDGTYLGRRTESGERDKKDPIEDRWRQVEKERSLAECKRVFYVALTRPKERLILVYPEVVAQTAAAAEPRAEARKKKGPAKEEDPDADLKRDFWRGWIAHSGAQVVEATLSAGERDPEPRLDSVSQPVVQEVRSSAGARFQVRIQRPRHSVTEWNLLFRCPRAYEWSYVRPVALAEGISELGLFTGTRIEKASEQEISQKELGTRVHSCLERGDYDGLKALEQEVGPERFLAEPVLSWAMTSPLMAPPGSQDVKDVWPELAFEIPVAGEVLVGSLDRLVLRETEQGLRYSIVDFKVTEKAKSVDALLEAYQQQLQLYTWAVSQLEPQAVGRIDALLVNISFRTVQTVPVPLTDQSFAPVAIEAAEIVAGKEGPPKPGPLCRMCEFKARCPEGRASI